MACNVWNFLNPIEPAIHGQPVYGAVDGFSRTTAPLIMYNLSDLKCML